MNPRSAKLGPRAPARRQRRRVSGLITGALADAEHVAAQLGHAGRGE